MKILKRENISLIAVLDYFKTQLAAYNQTPSTPSDLETESARLQNIQNNLRYLKIISKNKAPNNYKQLVLDIKKYLKISDAEAENIIFLRKKLTLEVLKIKFSEYTESVLKKVLELLP